MFDALMLFYGLYGEKSFNFFIASPDHMCFVDACVWAQLNEGLPCRVESECSVYLRDKDIWHLHAACWDTPRLSPKQTVSDTVMYSSWYLCVSELCQNPSIHPFIYSSLSLWPLPHPSTPPPSPPRSLAAFYGWIPGTNTPFVAINTAMSKPEK